MNAAFEYHIPVFDGLDYRQISRFLKLPSQIRVVLHPVFHEVRNQQHLGQIIEGYNGAIALRTPFNDALAYVTADDMVLGFDFVALGSIDSAVDESLASRSGVKVLKPKKEMPGAAPEQIVAELINQYMSRLASQMQFPDN